MTRKANSSTGASGDMSFAGRVLTSNMVKSVPGSSEVSFGSATVRGSSPMKVELKRNVDSGRLAFARAAAKITKAGVLLRVSKSVPLYRADPRDPSRLIRELKGKTSVGKFVDGKFKASIKR